MFNFSFNFWKKKRGSKQGFEPQNIKNGQRSKKAFSFKSKMKLKSWASGHKKKGSGVWSRPLKVEGGSEKGGDLRRVGVLHTTVAIHKANGDASSCLAGSKFQLCVCVRIFSTKSSAFDSEIPSVSLLS